MTTYDVGDQVKVTAAYTNAAGSAADPTGVVFKVKPPSGTVTTYTYGTDAEVIKNSTGSYYLLVTLNEAGTWHTRSAGTGAIIAAAETAVEVGESQF